jgi:hypothetical protein
VGGGGSDDGGGEHGWEHAHDRRPERGGVEHVAISGGDRCGSYRRPPAAP